MNVTQGGTPSNPNIPEQTASTPRLSASVREQAVKEAHEIADQLDEHTKLKYIGEGGNYYFVPLALIYDAAAAIRALAALTAAAPHMSGVKVKQLEWVHYDAETQFGKYSIQIDEGEELHDSPYCAWSPDGNLGHFDSKELAKAAAQADYEKRILSAIEPSSAREQALEEAVNLCSEYAQSFEKGLCHYGSADKDKWRLAQEAHISAGNKLATAIRALKSQPAPQTGGGE